MGTGFLLRVMKFYVIKAARPGSSLPSDPRGSERCASCASGAARPSPPLAEAASLFPLLSPQRGFYQNKGFSPF